MTSLFYEKNDFDLISNKGKTIGKVIVNHQHQQKVFIRKHNRQMNPNFFNSPTTLSTTYSEKKTALQRTKQ